MRQTTERNLVCLLELVIRVRVAVGILIVFLDGFFDGVGPLDVSGFFGSFACSLDGLVEPALLLPLGISEIEHQAVEKVGVADKKAEIVVSPGSLLGELAAGGVGEVVSLCEAHLLLLLWW